MKGATTLLLRCPAETVSPHADARMHGFRAVDQGVAALGADEGFGRRFADDVVVMDGLTDVPNPISDISATSCAQPCWLLNRNCSVTPVQLCCTYLFLCATSFGIGLVFWANGVRLVLGFAGLELLAVGVAFLAFARHATDGERISLVGAQLVVEREIAGRLERAEFLCSWVRVEFAAAPPSLIKVSALGRSVAVGRFVRPESRAALAREIRIAVRSTSTVRPGWADGS